jgi:hypothetical protein
MGQDFQATNRVRSANLDGAGPQPLHGGSRSRPAAAGQKQKPSRAHDRKKPPLGQAGENWKGRMGNDAAFFLSSILFWTATRVLSDRTLATGAREAVFRRRNATWEPTRLLWDQTRCKSV